MVLSFDRYSRDDVIGEVMVDLSEPELAGGGGDDGGGMGDGDPVVVHREITPRSLKVSVIKSRFS